MNIQIFGKKKCFDTAKALRYFKERGIRVQEVDVQKFGLSKGELNSVVASIGIEKIMDKDSFAYKTLNIEKLRSPAIKMEILLQNPKLYRTPILRFGKQASVGYEPELWAIWKLD